MCDMNNGFIETFDCSKNSKYYTKHYKGKRKDLIAQYRDKTSLFWGTFDLIKYDDDPQFYLEVGGDSVDEFPIKYCPFCGQELKGN